MRSSITGQEPSMKRSLGRDSARKRVFRGALAALWLFGSAAGGDEDAEHVHDLRAAGTILSLEHFIADARGKHPGRIIDAKLHYEQSHGHYVYEILILDRRGEVWELEYDAHNGVLIERELGGD